MHRITMELIRSIILSLISMASDNSIKYVNAQNLNTNGTNFLQSIIRLNLSTSLLTL